MQQPNAGISSTHGQVYIGGSFVQAESGYCFLCTLTVMPMLDTLVGVELAQRHELASFRNLPQTLLREV